MAGLFYFDILKLVNWQKNTPETRQNLGGKKVRGDH
jgi:hypothetical protein